MLRKFMIYVCDKIWKYHSDRATYYMEQACSHKNDTMLWEYFMQLSLKHMKRELTWSGRICKLYATN